MWQIVFLAVPFLRFLRAVQAVRVARVGRVVSSPGNGTTTVLWPRPEGEGPLTAVSAG